MNENNDGLAAKNEEDIGLIKAFLGGEEAGFNALMNKYKDVVFNMCLRYIGDYEEANDCAQDVFVKVFKALKNFRYESMFSTWLYRICINTCKNKVSSSGFGFFKRVARIDAPAVDDEDKPCMVIADKGASPDQELEKKENQKIISEAILALKSDQRDIIILRDIEDLSYEEISGITGYALGTVKSKIARAREAIIKKIGKRI